VTGSESVVALTGAGISVESGIPDFRSPGGLWEKFDPSIYATIDTFYTNPESSWELFRAVGETLEGKEPNPAHLALARMEKNGYLKTVITQNIDSLHQKAGNKHVIEVHGEHRNLECLKCRAQYTIEFSEFCRTSKETVPLCEHCRFPLKPNVVLFGESVRNFDLAYDAALSCDALFVIGTSAQVYPVASLPYVVKDRGGLIIEFDLEETPLTGSISDYFFKGNAGRTVPMMVEFWSSASGLSRT
jgi:NAD-dependent deacetylase